MGAFTGAWAAHESTSLVANPIRRVVTLLQNMQKKVEEEGAKEKKLFEKFMCYCKNGLGDLRQGIDAAEAKVPKVTSALAEAEALKEQLDKDIGELKGGSGDAKAAIAKATGIRDKEAAAFAKDSADRCNLRMAFARNGHMFLCCCVQATKHLVPSVPPSFA